MQAQTSAKSSFISSIGRFRNGGLVGSAIAILIGFIEAAATHASELVSDDVATHDHAGGLRPMSHQPPIMRQPRITSSNGSSPLADAIHGSGHDATLSATALSIDSNSDGGAGHTLANSDSFWFNVDGPVHVSANAEADAHSAAGSLAALSDIFADHSAASAEVTFTSGASSSFQYSGPSILDTGPGGAHAHWADAIDVPANTVVPANFAANDAELNGLHQSNTIENNLLVIGVGGSKRGSCCWRRSGDVPPALEW